MRKLLLILFLLFPVYGAWAEKKMAEHNIVRSFMVINNSTIEGMKYYDQFEYKKALISFIKNSEKKEEKTDYLSNSVNAGILYEQVVKDDNKAISFYKKAALGGNKFGQYNYAVMLFFINNDKVNSYKWLICAVNQNHKLSKVTMKNLLDKKLINENQIKEAKLLAKKDCK